jgi:hypothetical protein|tara:strand:+ start:1053 stop:1325 length:273 start_codon:yes stop_codon:yes gene_type:complete
MRIKDYFFSLKILSKRYVNGVNSIAIHFKKKLSILVGISNRIANIYLKGVSRNSKSLNPISNGRISIFHNNLNGNKSMVNILSSITKYKE